MLEDIRKYVMHRMRDNRDNCNKWICDLVLEFGKNFMIMVLKAHYVICYEMVTMVLMYNIRMILM